jgi:glycine dehydrogenase subunit 1
MAYAPHTPAEIESMLRTIGVDSVKDLFAAIPTSLRLGKGLDLADGISEAKLRRRFAEIARANLAADELVCFAGAGTYQHDIPAIVAAIALRSEFATAYTPYQPEVSQGTLQVIYEFQTYICRLTGLEVANASLYDGATALAEAVLMAVSHTRRKKVLLPATLFAAWRRVLDTYLQSWELELVELAAGPDGRILESEIDRELDDDTACMVLAQPNGMGILEDTSRLAARFADNPALLIAAVNPTTLSLVEAPGSYGASIAVGEGQPMGIPMSFGGPRCGFMAVRDELKRRMPGRLVGETTDVDGERGFVLTLQTREQHIRREKATSNICTNQGLAATMATIYMSTLGKRGLQAVARACLSNAHHLATSLRAIPALAFPYDAPFFHEFVVRWPLPAREVLDGFARRGILGGVVLGEVVADADENDLLVAVTELRTREELDAYVDAAAEILTTAGALSREGAQ